MTEDHVLSNRAIWDEDAPNWVESGRRAWASDEPTWGIWGIPDAELHMLPEADGRDVVELGCGTGYVSAWLARRGGRCVALDNSSGQLATARSFQDEFDLRFPLVHADAERVPFADASFDVAISEYGAAIWCDPYRWVPEAARLLRPEGELVFLGHAPLIMLCMHEHDADGPAGPELLRDQFGMRRFVWPDEGEIDFAIPHGEMVRLLRGCGFEVEDLIEVQAPEGAVSEYEWVSGEWAHRWPTEDVWKARKVR
jgi:SAM-dependent methyltransferase